MPRRCTTSTYPLMATADTPFRIGDIVALGEFHQDFLSGMLDEDVPEMVTIEQARALLVRMRELDLEDADFELMAPLILDFETLVR